MTYLFARLCWWIVAAVLIGLATGWFTFSRHAKNWKMGWLTWGLAAFAAGCVVALLKWLPDAPGFWLESALFLFAAFVVGCLLGSCLHALACPCKVEDKPLAARPMEDSASKTPAVARPATAFPGIKPDASPLPAGGADDLKLIRGIGPKNEKILNDLGVYRFCQIGKWTNENVDWINHHIAFPGRIERERWVEQGKLLCAGVETAYAKAVKSGAVVVDSAADEPLTEQQAKELKTTLPQLAAQVENEADHPGARPLGLTAPLTGMGDDLKLIKGVGPQTESLLHGLGVWHFSQIASWTAEHAQWIGSYLAFPGRIEREDWVGQASALARGGTTEFAERVKRGEVPTSLDEKSNV